MGNTTEDSPRISVVTPTLNRPSLVSDLISNLKDQSLLPFELVLVDGAPEGDKTTRGWRIKPAICH